MCEPHYGLVSCERVFEMTTEVRSLIEEQDTLLSTGTAFSNMSAEELTAYAQRHARIGQLCKRLREASNLLSCAVSSRTESVN